MRRLLLPQAASVVHSAARHRSLRPFPIRVSYLRQYNHVRVDFYLRDLIGPRIVSAGSTLIGGQATWTQTDVTFYTR